MATLTRIPVRPNVLKWARESAGLDLSTAAVRIGVKPERVADWESGRQDPTIQQLRNMADVYERPLAALFMPEPLTDEPARSLPDFRRAEVRSAIPPKTLQKAIMRAHRQRDALQEVAVELDLPDKAVIPQFTLDPTRDGESNGATLREALSMALLPEATLLQPDVLLRELVRRAEALNVTVIQVQRVDVREMRGFSLGDGPSPIVALNGADWPRGKIYTLLHELAHVGFRSNGLCDLEHASDVNLERQCDEIAAAALMPAEAFLGLVTTSLTGVVTRDLARAVGNEFGTSAEAALLRMVTLQRASWDDYWRLKPEFDQAYLAFKAAEKEKSEGKDSPIFYQVKVRDLGRRFIREMLAAHGEQALSSRDLVQLLEVSYDKVPKLAGTAGEEFS